MSRGSLWEVRMMNREDVTSRSERELRELHF